jgi:hypothetical protein
MKLLTVALTLALAAFAQQHPLTNADVVHAIEQGSSTDAIIQSIKTARSVDFRISPEYTPQLEKAGVPKEVIDAMIRRVMDDEARSAARSQPEGAKPIQSKPPKPKRGDASSARPEPAATPRAAQPVPQAITAAPATQAAPTPGPPAAAVAVSAGSTPTSLPSTAAMPPMPPHTQSIPSPPSSRPAKPATTEKSKDTITVTSIPDAQRWSGTERSSARRPSPTKSGSMRSTRGRPPSSQSVCCNPWCCGSPKKVTCREM